MELPSYAKIGAVVYTANFDHVELRKIIEIATHVDTNGTRFEIRAQRKNDGEYSAGAPLYIGEFYETVADAKAEMRKQAEANYVELCDKIDASEPDAF